MEKRVKDEERSYFERITGEWSDDGGILINRFPREARTRLAWMGGDDYELCFTVPESNQEALKKVSEFSNVNITRIGVVSESLGLQVKGYDGPRKSYQHF